MKSNRAQPAVRRPRKSGDKPAMPSTLEPVAAGAKARLRKRHVNPGVAVEVEKVSRFGYRVISPHRDHASWEAMICDALGTRSVSTATTFVNSLTQLCSQNFHPAEGEQDGGEWCPDEIELNMILNLVAGIKPRNEMEAAMAAQMVAVHLMTMKTAARALEGWSMDSRLAALAAKLARTFTMQWDALMRHRGKRQTTRQNITVRQEKHIHHHQHVYIEGGEAEIGDQPHAKDGDASVATLLGEDTAAPAVPLASHERQARVPNARRE